MKNLKNLWLLLISAAAVACSTPFEVTFESNDRAIIRINEKTQCLWLPVDNEAPSVQLSVVDNAKITTPLNICLAVEKVEYYMPLYLDATMRDIVIEGCPQQAIAWQKLCVGGDPNLTQEYRQAAHFTPLLGWINDPNGMVYHDGEWHLFYQYNTMGSRWGNMSWGHAVSRDLVKWEHLPTALYPDAIGAIFSGSAIIDKHNTAGFGENAMVAIYTSAGAAQTQSIAYSHDNGRTFTKYENNPVLKSDQRDFRDPKVTWHEPTQRWIMPLACGNAMEFYSSTNLREWHFESRWGEEYGCHEGVWECPDLIEMPYKGSTKWVLFCSIWRNEQHGSAVQYFVGDFDGHTFTCDTPKEHTDWIGYGRDNYAIVTWSNAPNGRKVALGWQNNWQYASGEMFPSVGYRGYMSLPCELQLIEWEGNAKLISKPVKEFDNYLKEVYAQSEITITEQHTLPVEISDQKAVWIELTAENKGADVVGVKLSNDEGEEVNIYFDHAAKAFKVDRTKAGDSSFHELFAGEISAPMSAAAEQQLTIVLDHASVECFTDISTTSDLIFPTKRYKHITLYTTSEATIKELKVKELDI